MRKTPEESFAHLRPIAEKARRASCPADWKPSVCAPLDHLRIIQRDARARALERMRNAMRRFKFTDGSTEQHPDAQPPVNRQAPADAAGGDAALLDAYSQ